MTSRTPAARPRRRSVTALLIATIAFAGTVAVVSWPRQPATGPVAAALSSGDSGSQRPAAASPTATHEIAGGGDAPADAPPNSGPAATVVPGAVPDATAPPPATAPAVAEALHQKLQSRLNKLRSKYAIPGVSVTIILNDGATWTGTSGLANVRKKTRVKEDTAFALASVSKTYTAALILALADEGKLDLDARVSRLLPKVRFTGRATVRQLLNHTSGLPDFFLNGKIDRALFGDRSREWTERDAFRYVGKPIFTAGKGWYYSNTNYALLGMIAEAVEGRPLAEQLRTRFLDPLGLDHTYQQVAEKPRGPIARGYRVLGTPSKPVYRDQSDGSKAMPFTSVVTAAGGAGSMAATSGDAARWARALYAGDVLPEATVRAMIGEARKTARFHPKIGYGLGVQVAMLDGRPTLGHSGRLVGFRSVVRHLPEEGITIAVLMNESNTDPTIIAKALLRIVSPPPKVEPTPSQPAN
jgi:D-alanyl-D-alanine carboxypeptidase